MTLPKVSTLFYRRQKISILLHRLPPGVHFVYCYSVEMWVPTVYTPTEFLNRLALQPISKQIELIPKNTISYSFVQPVLVSALKFTKLYKNPIFYN